MNKWTKKQLEEIDNITFAIAILNDSGYIPRSSAAGQFIERRQSTTNPYSLLNQKISSAIMDLEKIKAERLK